LKLKSGDIKRDRPRAVKGICDQLISLRSYYLKFHWTSLLSKRKLVLKMQRSKLCMNFYSDRKSKRKTFRRLSIEHLTKTENTNVWRKSFSFAFSKWRGSTKKSLSNMSEL
jgi:hypothetical protein